MVVLTKGLKHERHELLLSETFDSSDLLDHVTNQMSSKEGQRSIKMTKA
jgi:hypothetical protein